jgi:hypothetical protein
MMNDLDWLEFLDRIALEKSLTRTQKETLKAKFPGLGLIVDDSDLSYDSKDTAFPNVMRYSSSN